MKRLVALSSLSGALVVLGLVSGCSTDVSTPTTESRAAKPEAIRFQQALAVIDLVAQGEFPDLLGGLPVDDIESGGGGAGGFGTGAGTGVSFDTGAATTDEFEAGVGTTAEFDQGVDTSIETGGGSVGIPGLEFSDELPLWDFVDFEEMTEPTIYVFSPGDNIDVTWEVPAPPEQPMGIAYLAAGLEEILANAEGMDEHNPFASWETEMVSGQSHSIRVPNVDIGIVIAFVMPYECLESGFQHCEWGPDHWAIGFGLILSGDFLDAIM